MPKGLEDAVRAYQTPIPAPAQLYLSQYNLAASKPIVVTPGFGGSGAGALPPIHTGTGHYDITVTHYLEQASVEVAQEE